MTAENVAIDNKNVEKEEDPAFGGLYHRVLKLITGEEVIAGLEAGDLEYTTKKYITISNPIVFKNGFMQKWASATEQTEFEILADQIIAMYYVADKVLDEYDALLDALYINHVKDLLRGDMPDSERAELEADLFRMNDGSFVPEEPIVIDDSHLMAVQSSKYLH